MIKPTTAQLDDLAAAAAFDIATAQTTGGPGSNDDQANTRPGSDNSATKAQQQQGPVAAASGPDNWGTPFTHAGFGPPWNMTAELQDATKHHQWSSADHSNPGTKYTVIPEHEQDDRHRLLQEISTLKQLNESLIMVNFDLRGKLKRIGKNLPKEEEIDEPHYRLSFQTVHELQERLEKQNKQIHELQQQLKDKDDRVADRNANPDPTRPPVTSSPQTEFSLLQQQENNKFRQDNEERRQEIPKLLDIICQTHEQIEDLEMTQI